jgi:type 1 glutamine amidotransferase
LTNAADSTQGLSQFQTENNCMNVKMMLQLSLTALVLSALLAFASGSAAAEPGKTVKVLLITGDDVEPPHNWREVSQAIRETLVAAGKFDVRVCEDAGVLDSAATLGRYDLVLLAMYNAKTPTLSAAAKANLAGFVSGGKGLVISHLSSASFKEWAEFPKLCGRYWVMGKSGHGPRSVFKARLAKKDHPITAGLADFEADDELYAKLQGDAPITVLVEADSDWSKQTEPLAFTVACGQGRVFHETFGHDAKAVQNPSVQKLLQRGCEWAATGKVE